MAVGAGVSFHLRYFNSSWRTSPRLRHIIGFWWAPKPEMTPQCGRSRTICASSPRRTFLCRSSMIRRTLVESRRLTQSRTYMRWVRRPSWPWPFSECLSKRCRLTWCVAYCKAASWLAQLRAFLSPAGIRLTRPNRSTVLQ